eukprot:gene8547-10508_t
MILDKTVSYPLYIRENITIRTLLDCIKFYYNCNVSNSSNSAAINTSGTINNNNNNNLSTTTEIGSTTGSSSYKSSPKISKTSAFTRLPISDIKEIISYIFTVIEMLITSNNTDKEIPEIQDIMLFIQDSSCESTVVIHSLGILLKLLHTGNKGFLTSFEQSGDIKPLLGLLKRENESIQVLVIKIVGKYLSRGFGGGGVVGTVRGSRLSSKTSSQQQMEDVMQFIADSLKDFPMSELIYRGLSEVVVDKIASSLNDMVNSPLLDLVGDPDRTSDFVHLSALQVICRLASRATSALQQKIVNELFLCLKHIPNVRTAILDCPNWQVWLLSLWPSPPSLPSSPPWSPPYSSQQPSLQQQQRLPSFSLSNEFIQQESPTVIGNSSISSTLVIGSASTMTVHSSASDRSYQSGIKEIITGILKILLFECISKKDGWKLVEETEAWVFSILPNGVPLERRIFYECLLKMEQELLGTSAQGINQPTVDHQHHHPHHQQHILLKNYVNLVSIIEDFVFSQTMNILAHRNLQSQWEDFAVVAKLLDIFDYTQSIYSSRDSGGTGESGSNNNIDLPTIEVNSGSSKSKNSIHTIYRMCLCIFQEAEACFYGEQESSSSSSTANNNQSDSSSVKLLQQQEEDQSFIIRVWGLPPISDTMDQIIQKNSIRIQTILASEKDTKEQIRHVMWIVCSLITIIRRYKEGREEPIVIRTRSIIISLLKSLLKTYGDLIDNYISPTGILSPLAESIGKSIGVVDPMANSRSSHLTFSVHSILSLNEPTSDTHVEFLQYFREKLLHKIALLDKLHEVKDFYENQHLTSAVTTTRRNKVLEPLKTTYNKDMEVVAYKCQKQLEKSFGSSQKLEISELQHRQQFEYHLEQQRRSIEKQWNQLYKIQTREITPWCNMDPSYMEKKIWKIHNVENGLRMNLLLRRDYGGSDHPEAALSNQQGSSAISSPPIKMTQDELLKNNQVLRRATLAKNLNQSTGVNTNTSSSSKNSSTGGDDLNQSSDEIVAQTQGLVGFEIDSFEKEDIVLDQAHENDWCLVSEGFGTDSQGGQSQQNQQQQSSTSTQFQQIASQFLQPHYHGSQSQQQILFQTIGEIIKPMMVIRCKMVIYGSKKISFIPSDSQEDTGIASYHLKEKNFDIKKIIGLHHRRYLLLPTGIELFFADKPSILVNFPSANIVQQVMKHLVQLSGDPGILFKSSPSQFFDYSSPQEAILKYLNPTARWKRREISNFEYLMTLNTIAGRSYNDLNQYPVFPWIINDYTISKLDLSDPTIYRDLRKPIGALNPARLELFLERFTQCPKEIPAFMYGTHYSSSGSVMFFLMRCEPFTSHFIKLQSGHFDHADRMFDSLYDCWRNCLNSSSDVKELTPEFFYLPDFLINGNQVNFGVKQNGKVLDDVVLPPWANSPYHFIWMNRMALESEYVSQNLHHWIDLIFGYKQKGKEAVKAHNIFYHLTYEGSVDIGAMQDPILREATRVQINNFGVTPSQLFTTPHPSRDPKSQRLQSTEDKLGQIKKLKPLQIVPIPFTPINIYMYASAPPSSTISSSVIGVVGGNSNQMGDRVLITGSKGDVQFYRYQDGGGVQPPTLATISHNHVPLSVSNGMKTKIGKPFCNVPGNPRLLIASGRCDYTLHIIHGDSKLSSGTLHHKAPITCIAFDETWSGRCGVGGVQTDHKIVVSGSDDTTAIVWELIEDEPSLRPLHILRGHNYGITCIALSKDNDICLTGSRDGQVIIHSLRKGAYIKTILHPNRLPIHLMTICDDGTFLMYSNSMTTNSNNQIQLPNDHNLYRYSINGHLIQSVLNIQPIGVKMMVTKSIKGVGSSYLLIGGGYQIVVRELINLEDIFVLDTRLLSGFVCSNVIVDFCLWGSDESYGNNKFSFGSGKGNTLSNLSTGNSSNQSNNVNSPDTSLILMVLLESCQVLIYSIDETGKIKSLSS